MCIHVLCTCILLIYSLHPGYLSLSPVGFALSGSNSNSRMCGEWQGGQMWPVWLAEKRRRNLHFLRSIFCLRSRDKARHWQGRHPLQLIFPALSTIRVPFLIKWGSDAETQSSIVNVVVRQRHPQRSPWVLFHRGPTTMPNPLLQKSF